LQNYYNVYQSYIILSASSDARFMLDVQDCAFYFLTLKTKRSNLSITAAFGTEESGRCKEVAVVKKLKQE